MQIAIAKSCSILYSLYYLPGMSKTHYDMFDRDHLAIVFRTSSSHSREVAEIFCDISKYFSFPDSVTLGTPEVPSPTRK